MSSILKDLNRKARAGVKIQWNPHDKIDGHAARRRLRQQEARQAKARKAAYGVEVDAEGRTPAGLIVPDSIRRSVRPTMGGKG